VRGSEDDILEQWRRRRRLELMRQRTANTDVLLAGSQRFAQPPQVCYTVLPLLQRLVIVVEHFMVSLFCSALFYWLFFMAFRKGAMICCGLDLDLSGLTAKKNAVDPEQMSPRPQFELPIA